MDPKTKLEIDFNDLTNLKTIRLIANSYRFIKNDAFEKYIDIVQNKNDINNATDEVENGFMFDGIITDDDTANFFLEYGDKGFISPTQFSNALNETEGDVTIFINSPGGNVFEAAKMLTALETHATKNKVDLVVNGLSASAATYLLFADGINNRQITKMSQIMIHKSWSVEVGNSDELIKAAERLSSVDNSYAQLMSNIMKADKKEILEMMAAETWFTADEAIQSGLVNGIYKPPQNENGNEQKPTSKRKMSALEIATQSLLYDD